MTAVIIIFLAFTVFFFFFNILLSHGKFRFRNIFLGILYGLAVGVPMTLASYFKWFAEPTIDPNILILMTIFSIVPFLYSKWYNILRGRESPFQAVSFTISIILFVLTFYIPVGFNILSVLVGWFALILYFVDFFRYPYQNSAWLSAVVEEVAAQVQTRGKYSSKPVIIHKSTGRRFVTGMLGLSLMSKTDRLICRLSRKLHRKLGEPNLVEFFDLLASRF
jgi:hypothetical protein